MKKKKKRQSSFKKVMGEAVAYCQNKMEEEELERDLL